MPTYEYECEKCKHHFEQFQSITAKALTRCPACKGKIRRLMGTGAGIIFKGSGFYQTDYRSDSYKKGQSSDSGSSSSATSSSSTTKTKKDSTVTKSGGK